MLRLTTLHCSVFYFILFFAALIEANRVYELSDKFVEAYQKDTKAWLVKFYAPWCHHCKQMEPTYMQVAQKLHNEDIGVHVGRIDCTRFQAVASHFSVRGFPTLMFINKDKVVEYHGDRTEDEILDFARRAVGPKVRQIANCEALKTALDEHKVYFIYFGNEIPSDLVETIDEYHALNWFYQSKDVCPGYSEGLHVIKGPVNAEISHKFEKDVHSAQEWFRKHRFPQFVKITMGNFNYMLHSGKSLIIGVVEEYHSVGKLINKENEQFRAVLEDIAYTYDKQDAFVFGWSSQTDLLSSIALQPIQPLPKIMVIESTTMQYHIMEEPATRENIIKLLEDLVSENIPMKGGNSYFYRVQRAIYEIFSSLTNMYRGNPILTVILIGLPFAFLSIIIYTSCCTDILDAKDEDEEELLQQEEHEKHD